MLLPLVGLCLAVIATEPSELPWAHLWSGSALWLLLRSMLVCVIAVFVAVALGFPLAISFYALPQRQRRWRDGALLVPLLLPGQALAVVALSWLGPGGITGMAPGRAGASLLYTPYAAGALLGLQLMPLVYFSLSHALRCTAPGALDAARLVCAPGRLWHRYFLPVLAPLLAASAALVAALSLASFDIPSLLRVGVYPVEIFLRFNAKYDPRGALLVSLPLLLVMLALWIPLYRGTRQGWFAPARSGSPKYPAIGTRIGHAILIPYLSAMVLIPIATLLWQCGSLTNFGAIAVSAWREVAVSLWSGTLTGVLAAFFALLALASNAALGRSRSGWLLPCCLAFLAVPGTIIGIGLIHLFSSTEPLAWWYRSAHMLPTQSLVRWLPLAVLLLAPQVAALDPGPLRAAALVRKPYAACAIGVLRPLLLPAAAVGLLILALSLGEIGCTVLTAPPGVTPLPVRIHTLLHVSSDSNVAGLSLLSILLVLPPVVLFMTIADRMSNQPT
jgi:iron(III) transport system permease protein